MSSQPRAALALDIDGTLTTGDSSAIASLLSLAKDERVPVYVNTARPPSYCVAPSHESRDVALTSRHYCLRSEEARTVEESKVLNMKSIAADARVQRPECVILIDDQKSNVDAVERAHFAGVHVDARSGITRETVDRVSNLLKYCDG